MSLSRWSEQFSDIVLAPTNVAGQQAPQHRNGALPHHLPPAPPSRQFFYHPTTAQPFYAPQYPEVLHRNQPLPPGNYPQQDTFQHGVHPTTNPLRGELAHANNFGYNAGLKPFTHSQQEIFTATGATAVNQGPIMEAMTSSTGLPQGQSAPRESVTHTKAIPSDLVCQTVPTNPTDDVVESSQESATARRPIPRATLPNTDVGYVEAGLSSRRTYSNKERGRSDFERRITPRSNSHSLVKNVSRSWLPCDAWGETDTVIPGLQVPEHLDRGIPSPISASRAPKPIEQVDRCQKESEKQAPIPRVVLPPSVPHDRQLSSTKDGKEVQGQALDAEAARAKSLEDPQWVASTSDEPDNMLKKKGGRKTKSVVYPDRLVLNGRVKSKTVPSVPTPINPHPHQLPSTISGAASWSETASSSTEKPAQLSGVDIESRRKFSRQIAMPLALTARKAKRPVGCGPPALLGPTRKTRLPQPPSVVMDASSTQGGREASLSKGAKSGTLSGAVNTTSAEQHAKAKPPPQDDRINHSSNAANQSNKSTKPQQPRTGKGAQPPLDDGSKSNTQQAEVPRSGTQRMSSTRLLKTAKGKESGMTSSGVKSAVIKGLKCRATTHSAEKASEKDLEEASEQASIQFHMASTQSQPHTPGENKEKGSTTKSLVSARTHPKSEHDNDTVRSVARAPEMDEVAERAKRHAQTPSDAQGAHSNKGLPATSSQKSSRNSTQSKARGQHITTRQHEPHRSQFEKLQDLSNSGSLSDPGHDSSASSITLGCSKGKGLIDAKEDADSPTNELLGKTARLVTVEGKINNSDLISQAQSNAKKQGAVPTIDGGTAERTEIVSVETVEPKAKTGVDSDEAIESDKRSTPEAPKKKKKKKKLKTGAEKKRQKREQKELADLDAAKYEKGANLVSSARESIDEDWTSVSTSTTAVASPQKSSSASHLITVGGMANLVETTQADFPGVRMKNSGHWVRYDTEDGQVHGFGFKPKLDDRGRPTSQNNNIHGFNEPWERDTVQYGEKVESIKLRAEEKAVEGRANVKRSQEFVGDNVRTITNPSTGKVKVIAKRKSKFGKGS